MGFFDWFFGGGNFNKTLKGKVGDIIYPAYNNTNGWFCKSRWDLVTKVTLYETIIDKQCIWDFSTVKALELIMEFPRILPSHKAKKPKGEGQ